MWTSWFSEGATEYSLANHTGPPVLWSRIRLAYRPNYSQSKPIKSNYNQLWIIRMPQRLIVQQDGAAACHFQKTVTLIFFFFGLPLHLCPKHSAGFFFFFSKNADRLQKHFTITRGVLKYKVHGTTFLICLLAHLHSLPSLLLNYWGSHWKLKHWNEWPHVLCAVTSASLRWFSLLLFEDIWPLWLSAICRKTIFSFGSWVFW